MYLLPSRTKLTISLLPISFLVILVLILTLKPHNQETFLTSHGEQLHIHRHLQALTHSACEDTLYPELCASTISIIPNLHTKSIQQIITSSVNSTVKVVQGSATNCTGLKRKLHSLKIIEKRALDDCLELLHYTIAELHTVVSDLKKSSSSKKNLHDIQTLFTAAMTNQYTCLDGFAYSDGKVRKKIEKGLRKISHLLSNSLVMLKKMSKLVDLKNTNELPPAYGEMKDGFPGWISRKDRKLLQISPNATRFNLVVAKDGTGHYTTITEAVNAAPNATTKRFLIHIKAGAYFENVEVIRKKPNLMFVGDGIGKTVIKASRNVVDGWTTFQSATVAVVGDNFIARDLTIENSAGPSKHQAVALRVGSDKSAFYRCSFVGYQDTLYVHSFRQFYKECDVYGTVDFIFGNGAVVLQNCNLYARRPNPGQKNMFTAQGRTDPGETGGISIIGCKIAAGSDLLPVQSQFKSYLGRPWKQYSRTVILNSQIDNLIDPEGWSIWDGDFALSTLYYGEYNNRGPGANTTSRVKWPGYRVINSSTEASQFTVANFIQGNEWLPGYNISYFPGLN
ncbi:pectinesterase [Ranunculus cassubicifolius]